MSNAPRYSWDDLASNMFYNARDPLERRSGHWTQDADGWKWHSWDTDVLAFNERLEACNAADAIAAPPTRKIHAVAINELLRPLRESDAKI